MIVAKIKVYDACALAEWANPITAGMVGAQVRIDYASEAWDGLTKTVVFSGAVTKDITTDDTIVDIPAECMAMAGVMLKVGVFGFRAADKKIVIPTVEANIGRVLRGTDPSGDESTNPALPVWADILETAKRAESISGTSAQEALNAAERALSAKDAASASAGYAEQAAKSAEDSAAAASGASASADQAKDAAAQSADAAKTSVDGLQKDLSKVKSDIAAEAKRAKDAEDNRIKKFYTGNLGAVNIEDSDDGAVRNLVIGGRSEQGGTDGINLYHYIDTGKVKQSNGITFTSVENDGISVVGTCTGDANSSGSITPYLHNLVDGKTYICNTFNDVVSANFVLKMVDGRISYLKNFVYDHETIEYVYPYFEVKKGATVDTIIYPMVCEETFVSHSYEPYTGGAPSPSPEYPQDINSVENPVLRMNGGNLYDEKWEIGVIGSDGSNGNASYRIRTPGFFPIIGGKGITIHDGSKTGVVIYYYTEEKEFIRYNNTNWAGSPADYYDTVPENCAYFRLCMIDTYGLEYHNDISVRYGMNIGYAPYAEQTAAIPFTLRGIGDVRDELYVYADGTGKLVQRIKSTEITGFEKWAIQISEDIKRVYTEDYCQWESIKRNQYDVISNCFVSGDASAPELYKTYKHGKNIYLYGDFNTVGEFTDLAKAKMDEGNPIIIMYGITPIETVLTAEQVKALFDLRTYYGGTNITYESDNGVEPVVNFDYSCALENFVEYIKAAQGDNRKFIYDMGERMTDAEYVAAMAYVNSEYASALAELMEV